MTAAATIREMISACPYQSLVGPIDAELKTRRPAVILAAPEPGSIDLDDNDFDAVRDLLNAGETVLVMAGSHAGREQLLDLLGIRAAHRIRQGGRA